jgi:hypothetical protein
VRIVTSPSTRLNLANGLHLGEELAETRQKGLCFVFQALTVRAKRYLLPVVEKFLGVREGLYDAIL